MTSQVKYTEQHRQPSHNMNSQQPSNGTNSQQHHQPSNGKNSQQHHQPSNGKNSQQHQPIGDYIEHLPVDNKVPSHNEIRIVDQLFQQNKSIFYNILCHTKDLLIIACLFIIISLPITDSIIKKFVTIADTSPYILLGVKSIIFVIIYFFIKNIYLVRK
jgi:hypothetical protein